MRVLFVTPELAPWVKSGGLGEIALALPTALRRAGSDVRVLVPAYAGLLAAFPAARSIAEFPSSGTRLQPCRLLEARADSGLPLLLIDCPAYYNRAGSAYLDEQGRDFADNAMRFGQLSRVAAALGSEDSPIGWRPYVVHCNDWPAGLAPAWLHFAKGHKAATLMTVHNLAFQGNFPSATVAELGLPPESFSMDGLEFWGDLSFMKAGLHYADRITTVSPRYAEEIQSEEYGYGFAGLLRWRKRDLSGILNGIDTRSWDPASDPYLPRHYEFAHMRGKDANKTALRQAMSLATDVAAPLLGNVGRITHQKGLDLVAEIADEIAELPAQLALLGSGDKGLEASLLRIASRHPRHLAVKIGFDEELAHLIEAGADIFLMPSRFEPCGLNQMYSLRYGTPPVVRATGGLADTVADCNETHLAQDTANGFVFANATADELLAAIRRAVVAWHDRALWRKLQRNGMRLDFGWERAAARYMAIYAELAGDANYQPEGRAAPPRPAGVRQRTSEPPEG